jgi:hypothetical protein
MKAVHVTEMQTALIQAFNAFPPVTPPVFSGTVSVGASIKASHILELRAAVFLLEGS